MSKLSFEIFCIENYADKKNRESCQVYRQFKDEGLLDLLRSDYEDLHGMGMESAFAKIICERKLYDSLSRFHA